MFGVGRKRDGLGLGSRWKWRWKISLSFDKIEEGVDFLNVVDVKVVGSHLEFLPLSQELLVH